MVVAAAVGVSVIGSASAFAAPTPPFGHAAGPKPAPAVVGPATQTPSTNAPLSLADVESSIGAPASWAAGYTGSGVDVAVLDTGVTPVPGLDGPNKVVYGPDLSFDSQAQTSPSQSSTDPTSTDPSSTDSASTDPTSTDVTSTDPTSTDPATTDPSSTDPSPTDPSSTDATSAAPAPTDSASTDATATDPPSTDPASTQSTSTDPAATTTSTDPASQDSTSTDPDGFGHGTAMAGLIAGNDGTPGGFSGVAPNSRIVSVKVGADNGAADVSQIIAGIDWVTQHAQSNGLNIRVLSLSLGTDSLQPYQFDPLAHAAEQAWKHGIVVVAAVGNQGANATTVSDPATDPFVLAIGAADSNGTVAQSDDVAATFSSVGTPRRHADLVAPGAYITSLQDPGSYLDTNFPAAQINGRFFRGSGTSQATAITAGAVADLLSKYPGLTPDQAKAMLVRSAVPIATKNPMVVGSGELNLANAEALPMPHGPGPTQNFPASNGLGSLEAARGDSHVTINGHTLTGNQDIFGNPWNPWAVSRAEDNADAWSGGQFNSATWSGSTWTSATWSSATWSSATWSSATWSSATWSSATWSSATWSSATWSSATWSSATWSGATWSGSTWA